MNFAVVQDLDSKQRNWLAEVMVGIITIDGKVDDTELPYLQKAMELVESQELKEKLLSVARLEKKVRVHPIQLEGELAFEVLKLLAGIMIVDGRLLPSEINFFYEVGHRLGLPDKALEKLWKTALREMEDRCPRAVARLGEEARVIALQQINLERATFRYHRPVVKGAHGSLSLQQFPDADPDIEKDWYSSLSGRVISTHQHVKDPKSFLLRFEFTQTLRDDHGLLQLLGISNREKGK